MLNVSRNFKNDIVSTNQTLKPVLVITNSIDQVLFTLTQDKDELFDIDGNLIRTINAISKVSNVKTSTDYDSKTLKINRLRCTLYNYYDVNTKLSEYINTNVVGKNLYLFYKSPSTDVIDIQNTNNNPDLALIYNGEINRVNFNDTSIDFSAEDKTQIKIADKNVPYMSIDKLPLLEREKLIDKYKDAEAVPMTFGKVDKAPVLPYLENNNERILNILFDTQPTGGTYKTAKIPKILDSLPSQTNNYYLYIKQNEDYIIFDHITQTSNLQYQLKSKVKINSITGFTNNYLIPELQSQNTDDMFRLWDAKGFVQRKVESVYASDGSILDIEELEVEDLTDVGFENIESINDNGGYATNWYRHGDNIQSNESNFDTGLKNYPDTTESGKGRWILLKLDRGVNNQLVSVYNEFFLGNTFFCCDWEMYQSLENETPNSTSLTQPQIERTGFFIAPISTEVIRNFISQVVVGPSQDKMQKKLNLLLAESDEDLNNFEEDQDFALDAFAPTDNTYKDAPIHLNKDNSVDGGTNYWGNFGGANSLNGFHPFRKIQGLYFGETGSFNNMFTNEANAHDYIAVFEYFPPYWRGVNSYQQGLKMDNIGFLQSVKIENILENEFYASIIGRKNHLFTEELDQETYDIGEIPQFPLDLYINGPNGTLPNFNIMLDNYYNVLNLVWTNVKEASDIDENNPNQSVEINNVINDYLFNESYDAILQTIWTGVFGDMQDDDSPFTASFSFYKMFIYKAHNLAVRLYQVWSAASDSRSFYNHDELFGESYVKSFGKAVLEYMYQTNIDYEENWNIDYRYRYWFEATTWNTSTFQFDTYIDYRPENKILQLTEGINNKRQYRWDSFEINTFDDWINNFYAYMDDLVQAIHQSIIDEIDGTYTGSYNWGGETITFLDVGGANLEDYAVENDWILGLGALEGDEVYIEQAVVDLTSIANDLSENDTSSLTTDGIIKKPSDIVMNILVNEMEYGKYQDLEAGNILAPDYDKFDLKSITESRNAHNWSMGFSVNKKTEGKKLIEGILKESKSYPRFTSDGRFGLLTIKESYTYDDIDRIINVNDVLTYKFEQTKREDITTSVTMFYRFDYGQNKYNFAINKSIDDIFPDYSFNGYNNYNILPIDGHKDIQLKYHTENSSVDDFANYTLMNNCNAHNMVNMKLPLNYIDLEVGDKIHIPLINNEKIFNIDYSKVDFANGQPIYPLWIIMETNIGVDSIAIKAYQLHYLGTDGNHGFELPDQEYQVFGNTNTNSNTMFSNGEIIPCWNYNPNATLHNELEIPFFDLNGDGLINVADITILVNHLTGNQQLTNSQKHRLRYKSNGQLKEDNTINVIDIISMVNIITQ